MNKKKTARITGILGLGLDNEDGHVRITRGKNFQILFGSEATHERMQETCIKINERLDKQGKTLGDLTHKDLVNLMTDVQ